MLVDHIGYAVKDIKKAKLAFEQLGYKFENIVEDKDRNIYIQFGSNGNYRIELIQTLDDEEKSPIKELLKKNGPIPYHICYKTTNMERDIEALKKQKWTLFSRPQEAIAFGKDIRVAFMMNRNIGMIELVEA